MRLVFVDLDGTLIDRPSVEARFLRHLFLGGWLGPRQWLAALAFFIVHAGRFGRHTARKNKAYLSGMEVDTIAGLAAQFVRHEVLPVLRPFLLRRLDEHRQAGDRIVLLTGAPDFIAEPLGRAIGAWAVVATRPAMTRARFDSRAPLLHPFDVAKLGCARELCAEIGARLDECTAYADAAPDLHLLRDVGRPIAVTPDPALERVAREHGWEIILPEDLAPVWGETGRVSVPD